MHCNINLKTAWNILDHIVKSPGDRIDIKMKCDQYRKPHYGVKTILRPSYLHNWISCTSKMTSLYWIRALFAGPQMPLCNINITMQGVYKAESSSKSVICISLCCTPWKMPVTVMHLPHLSAYIMSKYSGLIISIFSGILSYGCGWLGHVCNIRFTDAHNIFNTIHTWFCCALFCYTPLNEDERGYTGIWLSICPSVRLWQQQPRYCSPGCNSSPIAIKLDRDIPWVKISEFVHGRRGSFSERITS